MAKDEDSNTKHLAQISEETHMYSTRRVRNEWRQMLYCPQLTGSDKA